MEEERERHLFEGGILVQVCGSTLINVDWKIFISVKNDKIDIYINLHDCVTL